MNKKEIFPSIQFESHGSVKLQYSTKSWEISNAAGSQKSTRKICKRFTYPFYLKSQDQTFYFTFNFISRIKTFHQRGVEGPGELNHPAQLRVQIKRTKMTIRIQATVLLNHCRHLNGNLLILILPQWTWALQISMILLIQWAQLKRQVNRMNRALHHPANTEEKVIMEKNTNHRNVKYFISLAHRVKS